MIEKVIGKYIGFDVSIMVTQIVVIFESMTMLQIMAKFCCLGTKLILWRMNDIFKYYSFNDELCFVGFSYVYNLFFRLFLNFTLVDFNYKYKRTLTPYEDSTMNPFFLSILTRMLGFLFAIDGIILLPFQHG
jgi:hypothetical protein